MGEQVEIIVSRASDIMMHSLGKYPFKGLKS